MFRQSQKVMFSEKVTEFAFSPLESLRYLFRQTNSGSKDQTYPQWDNNNQQSVLCLCQWQYSATNAVLFNSSSTELQCQ